MRYLVEYLSLIFHIWDDSNYGLAKQKEDLSLEEHEIVYSIFFMDGDFQRSAVLIFLWFISLNSKYQHIKTLCFTVIIFFKSSPSEFD